MSERKASGSGAGEALAIKGSARRAARAAMVTETALGRSLSNWTATAKSEKLTTLVIPHFAGDTSDSAPAGA
jgi:hypothetical protein